MPERIFSADQVHRVGARLRDAVLAPTLWPEILDELCAAAGAADAALLPSDPEAFATTRTVSVDQRYRRLAQEWRAKCISRLMAGEKVIIEQDVHTPEPIERSTLYRDSLESSGFKWFAGIGFWAGNALWVLALRRTLDERQFDTCEAHVLSELSAQMTEAAIQSASLGQTALESKMRALDYVDQAALVLDRFGFVISANEATEAIFDSALCIRNGRLFTNDPAANSFLEAFLAQPRTDSDAAMPLDPALTVLSRTSGPLLIRILPVRGIARSPFLAAHSLVLLRDPYSNPGLEPKILSQVFGLSSAEARLAAVMASGVSLEQAAHQLGLALETVRNQLKAIFSKTETHRQAELVALLLRL